MTFKKSEKEIIKAIVNYGGEVKSLAEVINKSHLFEKKGIVIVPNKNPNFIFLSKEKNSEDEKDILGYVTECVSLFEYLIKKRLIVIVPYCTSPVLVVGKDKSEYGRKPGVISINDDKEFVVFRNDNWAELLSSDGQQTHWVVKCTDEFLALEKILNSWFTVSKELRDLVKNNFKSVEERRFYKQQWATWVSIIVAILIAIFK